MKRLMRITLLSALVYAVVACLLFSPVAQGQTQGGAGASAGRPQPAPQPANTPSRDGPPRPVFLSGSVRLTDGTVPPESVLIERVCNGQTRPEGYTDSQGNFSFLIGGQPGLILGDASTETNLPFPIFGSTNTGKQGNANPRDITGCEIQGKLAGYQSSSIILTSRAALDDPNIGIIHLRPLTIVDGLTSSVTTASAPKEARNAYEKGLDNAKKQKWLDAERDLLKAVQAYPRFALAWYDLGRVYYQEKKIVDAARAQNEAIRIDPRFISPYSQLTVLSAVQGKWDDVILHSSKVIKLSPEPGSDIYFYSAVAHYNLKKIDIAEDHARHAATLDPQHKNPRIRHLLGVILAQTHEYKEAAENLKLYLDLTPNAPEAAAIHQTLDEIDRAVGVPAQD
jgi:Flp pilus assembly protein TadD